MPLNDLARGAPQVDERLVAQIGRDGELAVAAGAGTRHGARVVVIGLKVEVDPVAVPDHGHLVDMAPANGGVGVHLGNAIPVGEVTVDADAGVGGAGVGAVGVGGLGRYGGVGAGVVTGVGGRGRLGSVGRLGRCRGLGLGGGAAHLGARLGGAAVRGRERLAAKVAGGHGHRNRVAIDGGRGTRDVLPVATLDLGAVPGEDERVRIALGAIVIGDGDGVVAATNREDRIRGVDGEDVARAVTGGVPARDGGVGRGHGDGLAGDVGNRRQAQRERHGDDGTPAGEHVQTIFVQTRHAWPFTACSKRLKE